MLSDESDLLGLVNFNFFAAPVIGCIVQLMFSHNLEAALTFLIEASGILYVRVLARHCLHIHQCICLAEELSLRALYFGIYISHP
jgi:hypothetical protein